LQTRTTTRSCHPWKRAIHVYSPSVVATQLIWPSAAGTAAAATSLLLLQLVLLL